MWVKTVDDLAPLALKGGSPWRREVRDYISPFRGFNPEPLPITSISIGLGLWMNYSSSPIA